MLTSKSTKRRFFRFTLSLFLTLWIIGFLSPCLDFNFLHQLYPFQKIIYSNVCHQNPAKSFICNNATFLVCARCSGIYFGALFSSLIMLLWNHSYNLKTKYLFLFSIPMLLDVILLTLEVYDYNKLVSSFTGFLFGSAVFAYILGGIENLLFTEQKNTNDK
ncbi:MAG: DUF2085 domain-containing protein [Ignavibacteriales bacterium]|nr:DUF2085 domain-containing protein [Ignavibacteriales bacterium]